MGRKTLSERQRKFAEYLVQGDLPLHAYIKAGYNANRKRRYISTCAGITARNPMVMAYMAELRKPRVEAAVLGLQEKREYLARVVRSSPEDVTMKSDLCQSVRSFKTGSVNVIMPSKLRAIELDAKLAGEINSQGKGAGPNAGKGLRAMFPELPESYGLPCHEPGFLEENPEARNDPGIMAEIERVKKERETKLNRRDAEAQREEER